MEKNSETTIPQEIEVKLNLIPPSKRDEIKKRNRLKMVVRFEILLAVFFIFLTSVIWSFKYILDISLAFDESLKASEGKAAQYAGIRSYDNLFKEVNASISEVAVINGEQLYWSKLFDKLEVIVNPGISIGSLKTSDFSVTLDGISQTRDDLIILKSNLEKDGCFKNIDLPLSNLVDKKDINFQIFFDVDRECLSNK